MAANIYADDMNLESQASFVYPFSWLELARALLIGEVVGVLSAALAGPLRQFVIEPWLCHSGSLGICQSQGPIAFGAALVILSVAAVLLLASLQSYQPLLNVLAPAAALWGIDQQLHTLGVANPALFYIFCGLLFAVAYGLFYLLLRIRNFWVSLVVTLIVIVLVRLQF